MVVPPVSCLLSQRHQSELIYAHHMAPVVDMVGHRGSDPNGTQGVQQMLIERRHEPVVQAKRVGACGHGIE